MTRLSEVAPAPNELTKLLPPSLDDHGHHQAWLRKLGLVAIFVLLWVSVAQSEASQAVQSSGDFNKPFFIVGFDHTITVVLLPLVYLYYRVHDTARVGLDVLSVLQRHSVLPLSKLLPMAVFLNAFYCFADYFWYAALANVSVAASTAIFNCSPFFVYCFSICFLRERASFHKLGGVLLSFTGVALIVLFQDGSDLDLTRVEDTSLLASVLVIISAAVYGAYQVAFIVVLGDEIDDCATLLILTGLCGLISIPMWVVGSFAFAWCPFEALNEPMGWPATTEAVLVLILSGSLAGLYTVLLTLALCWTTPLETSVACMLTIPLAGLWDMIFNHTQFSWECILGSFLVMAGFGVLECCSSKQQIEVDDSGASIVEIKALV